MENAAVRTEYRSNKWVRVSALNTAGSAFLRSNMRHMDRVCFGDEGNQVGSLAIKVDRLAGFATYAAGQGVTVERRD